MRLNTIWAVLATGVSIAGAAVSASTVARGEEWGSAMLSSRGGRETAEELLEERDDPNGGCAALGLSSDWTPCGQGMPDNFCCDSKAGFTCQVFNNNRSAVCCPPNTDCVTFGQIPCNPQGLNVTARIPGSNALASTNIHSTLILGGLLICQDKCCPVGYSCQTNGGCLRDGANGTAAAAAASGQPVATLSSAPTTNTGSVDTSSSTGGSGGTGSSGSANNGQCQAFPPTAVVVGALPGAAAGAIVAGIVALCISRCRGSGKRRQSGGREAHLEDEYDNDNDDEQHSRASLTRNAPPLAHGPISEPTLQDGSGGTRVDFLRRMSKSRRRAARPPRPPRTPAMSESAATTTIASSQAVSPVSATTPSQASAIVRGLFSSAGKPAAVSPQTPRRQPSTESITMVFSPPNNNNVATTTASTPGTAAGTSGTAEIAAAAADPRNTRWEDVMTGANALGVRGLAAPPAFLGSQSIVDGRRKALDGTARLR